MAARRRSNKTRDLPPNLYARNDGYYSFRDPRTGKEFGLGRDKRYAVNQAIAANMELVESVTQTLVDRMRGKSIYTMSDMCQRYLTILERRNLKQGSMTEYRSRIKQIQAHFGSSDATLVSTKDIAEFFESFVSAGKPARVKPIRSTLLDMFREAIAEGVIVNNPVGATRNVSVKVSRGRLSLEDFVAILDCSDKMQPWVRPCMELAIVTGQRAGDICAFRKSAVVDGFLRIEQIKTGTKLALPMTLSIPHLDITLGSVLEKCKRLSRGDYFLYGRGGSTLSVSSLSKAFLTARESSGIKWDGSPPSFHEIRSLSARLHKKNKGDDFAQRVLGHKSAQMTEKYIDARGSEWMEVNFDL